MAKRRHIRIEKAPTTQRYNPQGGGGAFALPKRNRVAHSQLLLQQIKQVRHDATALHPQAPAGSYSVAVEFDSEPGFKLQLDRLESLKKGIEIASAAQDGSSATVHVPKGQLSHFVRKIDEYASKDTKWKRPKNAELVESISSIRLATIRDFWTDSPDLFPEQDQPIWWEVWLQCPRGKEGNQILTAFRHAVGQAIRLDIREVRFGEQAVLLAWCTPKEWEERPNLMDYLAELRTAKEPAGPYLHLAPQVQAEFVRDFLSRVTPPPGNAPAVCVLDTGVSWVHPLLAVGMDKASAFTVNPNWLTGDHHGHGTEVAGLALYGCLTELLPGTEPLALTHRLESVKILPPLGHGKNDPKNYGAITQEAVARAEAVFPDRNRSVCMAVTLDDDWHQGYPTLWSAAIDQMCSGELDDVRRLMFVCAGNVVPQNPGYLYPNTNRKEGIEDPAQSWNAITVGAYTDRVIISAPDLRGWKPVARKGRLCPASRTSMPGGHEWPIKPDIVMEGGNYATDGSGRIDSVDDLSLLTTAKPIPGQALLTTSRDTSAAVALAARMGAVIQSRYPTLWPETVRGLMVHSAEWTPEMIAEFPTNPQRKDRLRCYGWGVPQLEKAIWSAENVATLIYEGQLQPYGEIKKIDQKGRKTSRMGMKEMHLHALPWPADILGQFPNETVRMRVTLSYFVEPSPGQKGWTSKHRYQSHGLRFKVKWPHESLPEFRGRLSREAQAEEQEESHEEVAERKSQGDPLPWAVGLELRARGSIHSDWWEGTAADIASCGYIGVFPVIGWWRERAHLGRWNHVARYSLIVSLETARTDIDLYAAIATQVGIAAEIET
jgi:hypothetical protein